VQAIESNTPFRKREQPSTRKISGSRVAGADIVTHHVVLLEFDLDVGIGLSQEIRVLEVVGLDESDSDDTHGELEV